MARKSNTVLSSDKDTNFNDGGAATAAEFRAQQQDIIDSKAHLDVTDALASDVAGKANTTHTHVLANITDAGTAAAADTGTGAGNVPVLDGSGRLPAVDGSQLTNLPGGVDASPNIVRLTGGSEAPTLAGYQNATVIVDSGTQILTAPVSGTDVYSFTGVNRSGNAATVGGVAIPQNDMFLVVVDGTSMTARTL